MPPHHEDPGDPRLAKGEAWEALCDSLRRQAERVLRSDVPQEPQLQAEGFRYLVQFLVAGTRLCVSHADPLRPAFTRMIEPRMNWGLDAPDCLYLYAAVAGGERYRVSGLLGTANHVDIQINAGHYASGNLADWETISSTSGDALATDEEGRFVLWLGGDGPPEPGANWLALREDAGFLLLRQYFGDWERERPADLSIERLGATLPAAPPTSADVADRLELLRTWLEQGGDMWEKMGRGFMSMPDNTLIVHLPENAGERTGMAGQAYGVGNFRCGLDEAVIVEFEPPPCHHWSVSLATWYFESIDFAHHQCSLNHAQAVLDPDGVFRGVIAHRDPGVANWLDAAGHTLGPIAARFLRAERAPVPSLRAVPFERLAEELPKDVARVGPEERAARLEARRRAVEARYRW